MDNKVGTRTCKGCHKEIAEVNFALHESHCSRFLCVCPDCDETVPRDQLDQHREEQHTQVRCSKCDQKLERCHLMDHEADECVERLQSCGFCDLQMPWKKLDEHTLICGSRTERCRDCRCYVKLSDKLNHALTCLAAAGGSSPPQTTSKVRERISVNHRTRDWAFRAEEIDEHELEGIAATRDKQEEEDDEDEGYFFWQAENRQLNGTYKDLSISDKGSRGPQADGGDPDQIGTCPHCRLALPARTLRWHEGKCQIYILLK